MPGTGLICTQESDIRASMRTLIEKTWRLNRVPVSSDMDRAVRILREELPFVIHEFPSGKECLTWTIPKKWDVKEASIETLDGKRLISFSDEPLCVFSYSSPFRGVLSREELGNHLLTDPGEPDAIPYHYRYEYQYGDKKDWGFAIPSKLLASMNEEKYRVLIDAEFGQGTLKVLDYTLKGKSPKTVFLCAHTCHPAQVNDGIAACAVGIELFRFLETLKDRKYTYRLILGPEYFAAAALLSLPEGSRNLAYGIYLDMPANGENLCFSRSFRGDTYLDKVARNVFAARGKPFEVYPYRGLWGNDEMFYDGPGFEIPMLGMGRKRTRHYHRSSDNLENCRWDQLEETVEYMKDIVGVFESDEEVSLTYRGPLHLDRYGLYIDPKVDHKGYASLQAIQILMKKGTSLLEIAGELGLDFRFVKSFADKLTAKGLAVRNKVIGC